MKRLTNRVRGLGVGIFILVAGLVLAGQQQGKYMGVEECWTCHEEPYKGNQYMKWKESKHAKAYETLALDDSHKIAKEMGIEDPQKSEKCLKCHVTAFRVSADEQGDLFKKRDGVQCESCHGPGQKHVNARLDAEAREKEKREKEGGDIYGDQDREKQRIKLPPGEIIFKVEEATCTDCHNNESPTYKEFKFEEAKKAIEHPDPRPRPE